jgi:hypothetical protein
MSKRRIARRVASMAWLQNFCTHAVGAQTLVTKVFHCSCRLFMSVGEGRRLVGAAERCSTGVRRYTGSGGARRVGCCVTSSLSPLVLSSLVTKHCQFGGVR